MKYYVYVILLRNYYPDGRLRKTGYYVGACKNITKRWREHLKGVRSKYIQKFWRFNTVKTLVYVEEVDGNWDCALKREKQIKGMAKFEKHYLFHSYKNLLRRVE